jgi:nitroreductase
LAHGSTGRVGGRESESVKLNLSADEVLSTTRAVRKRLDFDTPVPKEVITECLELALQAPTGSNSQGWQWVFVTDPTKKQAIADVYAKNFKIYANSPRSAMYPDGDLRAEQRDAITESATYLTDNFHRVPVMMIPCIEGRLDPVDVFRGASAWGSLLPAVWSFMLAARERALGTAWTTIHLIGGGEREVADIIGIPFDKFSQAGLFPIAYTLGTDFKPAKRLPLDPIVHWDTW